MEWVDQQFLYRQIELKHAIFGEPMRRRKIRISPWLFPILGAILGSFLPLPYLVGVLEFWHSLGNPGEPIHEILGTSHNSVVVEVESGALYTLGYLPGRDSAYPLKMAWKPSEKSKIILDDPKSIPLDYFHPLPPLFIPKQIYITDYPMIEGISQVRFAVSKLGDLYMWKYSIGGMEGLLRYVFAFLGFGVGGVFLILDRFSRRSI